MGTVGLLLAAIALGPIGIGGAAVATDSVPADVVGAQGPGVRVVAVGDIAYAGGPYARTAQLTRALDPQRVLLAGDIAYSSGSPAEFSQGFAPDWSGFRSMWLPVPGNHEYRTPRAAGYREFFDESGGLYWSRKVGSWRVIGLDSEKVSSAKQRTWLKATLKKHNGTPTLVMWHRPRYSRGEHSDQGDTARLFNLVRRDRDVKLLIWGHDHDYERMTHPRAEPCHGADAPSSWGQAGPSCGAIRRTRVAPGASSSTASTTACSTSAWPTAASAGRS